MTNKIKLTDVNSIGNSEAWFSQVLASASGANLRFRVMRDTTAAFHVHERCSECFFVISGVLHVDTQEGTVTLSPGQFCEVPSGLQHRARVEGEVKLLVFDALTP